jgi:hypothetical protein
VRGGHRHHPMHYGRLVTAGAMTRELWSGPGEGEHIWFQGSLVTIKVPGDVVDGRCALLEFLMPRGVSPPRHHHQSDEFFTMLEGELTFVAGTSDSPASPAPTGSFPEALRTPLGSRATPPASSPSTPPPA